MLNNIFEKLNATTAVITTNRNLAITLCKEFENYQLFNHKHAWESANIKFLDDWLMQLFYSQPQDHILLNPYQERTLWEKIITTSDFWHNNLASLNLSSNIATAVQEGWKLTRQWCLDLEQCSPTNLSENHKAFKNWASKFITLCKTNQWIDRNSIINVLINFIIDDSRGGIFPPTSDILLPKNIIFVNFEQPYPQLNKLITALKNSGCEISYIDINNTCGQQHKIALPNTEQELNAMAAWANDCAQKNPQSTIGCVVLNLKNLHDQIEYTFSNINTENFVILSGKPLTKFPIICDALIALNLGLERININHITRLLRSPFFAGSESEIMMRAMLDRKLRTTKKYALTVQEILDFANASSSSHFCPSLTAKIDEFLTALKKYPTKQTFNCWANCFSELLYLLGWNISYPLTSLEYQLIIHWQKLLQEFASLDLVEEPLDFIAALNKLNIIANDCVFQTKHKKSAPIKIVNLSEATGLSFEYAWIMGLTDEDWPPQAQPNVFIPLQIQQDLAMPHVNAAYELNFCQNLLQRFSNSANNIIYSYPLQNKEREYQPSALIKDFNNMPDRAKDSSHDRRGAPVCAPDNPGAGTRVCPYKYKITLEDIADHQAPAITTNESTRGGTKIFKLQAACPFRAFAECRLMAQELDTPKTGLDYIERGNLIHAALDKFWTIVKSHEQLISYTEKELHAIITKCLELLFPPSRKRGPESSLQPYLELERVRLQKLLYNWLQLEKQRPSFKVTAKEKAITTKIANTKLQLRIDRIDELEDGSLIIIDYKTGEVSSLKKWDDDRPDDPQLPLYCITGDKFLIGGAIIAQLKNGKLGFLGITKKDYGFTKSVGIVDNWSEVLAKWQSVLEKLSHDFYNGHAEIDPKYGQKTCDQCALQSLCRV